MDADTALIEAAFTLGRHSGGAALTPEGASMFSRLLALTVRAGIANDPDAWDAPKAGRAYVLGAIERLARSAADKAGPGGALSADLLRRAACDVIDDERRKMGITRPPASDAAKSKFCFAFMDSDLFDPPMRT